MVRTAAIVLCFFAWMLPENLTCAAELPREARGFWIHGGLGVYPGDWDRTAKLLAENGVNMVFPYMARGALAHYASEVVPRSRSFEQYGDQLEQCCKACRKYGIQVHAWKMCWEVVGAPKEFQETLYHAGRKQQNFKGKTNSGWICPSHRDNRKLQLDTFLEIARKYPVDGLQLDVIRYCHDDRCYCDGCRRYFEEESGRKVVHWPDDCHSGSRKQEYNDWRCQQISWLVENVSREAREIRPDIKISAAVFPDYPECRRIVAQDWPAWIRAGYLDFVCPMDYTNSTEELTRRLTNQLALVDGRIPLYAGIGALSGESTLTPDQTIEQIRLARSHGAKGFVIFNLDKTTAKTMVPAVGDMLKAEAHNPND
jgi:uncharacterized lipoprotein YddW (UPF0748 family)